MTDDPAILEVLRSASGRVGPRNVAFMIEAVDAGRPELDLAIGGELQVPAAQYTQSTDLAMSIIPEGWLCAFKPREGKWLVELTSPTGRAVQSVHNTLPLAICLASMLAHAPEDAPQQIIPEGTVTVSYV